MLKQITIVRLFEALGFKTSKTWDKERLLKKIKQLPELVDGVKIENPKVKEILVKILRSKKVGIRMTDAEERKQTSKAAVEETKDAQEETKETKKTKKKGKKIGNKSEQRKAAKKKNTTEEKDKFGSPVGSKNATINKCLSNKPKGMKELVTMAKLSGTFYDHLNSLVKKKFIEKTEKGFVLTGK